MKEIKEDFLTIPDAPNYEVNSQLLVRNKTTGHILKTQKRIKQKRVMLTKKTKERTFVNVKTCRINAVEAAMECGSKWIPIPSLNNAYEMSADGLLRNTRTKRIIKLNFIRGSFFYIIKLNGKKISRAQKTLLWETHGITFKKHNAPIAVTLKKDGRVLHFDSKFQAARFLAKKYHFAVTTMQYYLRDYKAEICGWQVKYHPPEDLSEVKVSTRRILGC